ncbi:sialoadhesin-like isoform X1 [Pelobates fuscus]|uniref:sialoadhesin-like isoform X1 n=1 Tax=Pelobates fuscus TaxID=191477 RepID=UPI002FE4F5EB
MSGITSYLTIYSIFFSLIPTVCSVKPKLRLEPEQPVYIVGENFIMRCEADGPSTVLTYSFYKDGALILNSTTNVLEEESVSKFDSGVYFCIYQRASVTSTESDSIKLNIIDRPDSPSISFEPMSTIHFIGQTVTVRCLLQSRSGVTAIHLYHDGNEVIESDNFGVLTFREIKQRNAGNFTCAFYVNESGRKVQSYLSEYKPLIVTESLPLPTLSIFPNNPQTEGQEVKLTCHTPLQSNINGYRFFQNGREVTEKGGSLSNLYIFQIYKPAFEGCYFCKTFRIILGHEVSSPESPERFLTEKQTGGRGCKSMNEIEYTNTSHQELKFYGSILVGKFIVWISMMVVFWIQLSLIKRKKKAQTRTETQSE